MSVPPPMPPQQPPGYVYAPQPMNPADEKMWSILVHIGGIFFAFVPALIGYLVMKDRGPFINANTKTALNFQITVALAYVVGSILVFILIGGLVLLAAYVLNIVFSIIAAVKASRGEWYTYPLTIPFIK